MNIDIHANGIPAEKDVQHFVRLRAELSLSALSDQIGLVSVFVDSAEESGCDGEVRCVVLIRLLAQPDVVVEITHSNLYVAIHRAVDEAGWILARSLADQQSDLMHLQVEMIDGWHARSTAGNRLESGQAA